MIFQLLQRQISLKIVIFDYGLCMKSLSLVYTHESSIITRRGFIESGEDGARGSFEIPLWQADKCQLRAAGKRTWTAIQSTHTQGTQRDGNALTS